MLHSALALLLALAAAAAACVENGYGERGDDGVCRVVYCHEGHQPHPNGTRCSPCPRGTYSDREGLEPCAPCANIPFHARGAYYGEKTPDCAYRCHAGTYTVRCLAFYDLFWRASFALMGLTALWYLATRGKSPLKSR